MFDFTSFFADRLDALHREHRYRRFRTLEREPCAFPRAYWRSDSGQRHEVVVWCSNDYLGMSQHEVVRDAARKAIDRFGNGAGGTRNISGTHSLLVELERELADLHGRGGALVFSSGYVANDTTLATLGRLLPGCVFFSDAGNHASMIEGMRRSGARCQVFAHNDAGALDVALAQTDPRLPRIVAIESLYSMGGDIAPLQQLVAVARAHSALIFIDETHAVGVHGPEGAGLVAAAGLSKEVDIVQGGLGKGYGVVGGFVTASATLIDFIRSHAPGFIFTTALPPSIAASALASVRHLRDSSIERQQLLERVDEVRDLLSHLQLTTVKGDSQILPWIIGDPVRCERIAEQLLLQYGIYLQPINSPTVPQGTERLRITPTPLHTPGMIERLAGALAHCAAAPSIRTQALPLIEPGTLAREKHIRRHNVTELG